MKHLKILALLNKALKKKKKRNRNEKKTKERERVSHLLQEGFHVLLPNFHSMSNGLTLEPSGKRQPSLHEIFWIFFLFVGALVGFFSISFCGL